MCTSEHQLRESRVNARGRFSAPYEEVIYIENVANGTRGVFTSVELARLERDLRCLACDGPLEEPLRDTGSLRCLDCRELNAPLDPTVVLGRTPAV